MSAVSHPSRSLSIRGIKARAHHSGLHGHKHIVGQRTIALFLTYFAVIRTLFWLSMMIQQVLGVQWVVSLTHSVSFVAFISFYANGFTDFGTFTAGLAALFSADAHHDSEHTRRSVTQDFQSLEEDIARLADTQPGPEARSLAADIRHRLTTNLGVTT